MYITRTLEKSIRKVTNFFPVLLVTGPRQVGKTTVLQACADNSRNYVSLDTLEYRKLAQEDPALFLQRFRPPLLIDEIQYAPQLFPYIKAAVDEEKKPGMYWLTGSQQLHLMKNVSESLAGRVGILRLAGLSLAEMDGYPERPPFLPVPESIEARIPIASRTELIPLFHRIWKGSYPTMRDADDAMWQLFYDGYVQTYIERDIRSLGAVSNELDFMTFMKQARGVYDYEGKRIVFFSESFAYQWVYMIETSTWHKMSVHDEEGGLIRLKSPLNSYPECYVNAIYEDGNGEKTSGLFNLSTRYASGDSGVRAMKGIVITRPFDLGEPDVRKVIKSIRLRGRCDERSGKKLQYILLGSNDGVTFHRLSSLRHSSWKLYMMAIVTSLDRYETFSWIDIDYETRFTNRLR